MSNVENVCPQVLRGVARELRRLAERPPAGVKLVLRDDDLTDVPPRAYFLTRIFHPNVAPATGEVCVNTLKRDWRPELGLEHALLAVKCLLIAPNPESALNADAAALLRDHYDLYFARAKLLADIHARPHATKPDKAGNHPQVTRLARPLRPVLRARRVARRHTRATARDQTGQGREPPAGNSTGATAATCASRAPSCSPTYTRDRTRPNRTRPGTTRRPVLSISDTSTPQQPCTSSENPDQCNGQTEKDGSSSDSDFATVVPDH
ncbi:unnamed protein product [Chilo suppressalis]|uniref:UBC core domain-containing protein n=1 Tax=Chilo suppressalis TaxID=168631 RepID=A0ABN8BD62_CHISP|nr:unnamed protein product [Chilo suppressalis]